MSHQGAVRTAPRWSFSLALRPVWGMAPATRADESRPDRAAPDRARREACVRIEVAAERRDDSTPRVPDEAARDSGCLAARQGRVQRPVRAGAGAPDVEAAEDVADAVRRVHEAPRADPECAGEARIDARRRSRIR